MTNASASLFALALCTATVLSMPATAEDIGQMEFMNSCASCHGSGGKGDGQMAKFLKVAVPDLTTLSAKNNGVFPMSDVLHIVDGRRCGPILDDRPCSRPTPEIQAHGAPMPVWGDRFKEDAIFVEEASQPELIVRGRVLSLAYYLESIQK